MDFNALIAEFAARHNVAGLAAEAGLVSLDIDSVAVTIVAAGDGVVISAEIGKPPAQGRAEFADILLESNLESDAFFAKTRETDTYVLVRYLPLANLDGESFDAALETLVNTAETWRLLLANFHLAETGGDAADPVFSPSGFMQV